MSERLPSPEQQLAQNLDRLVGRTEKLGIQVGLYCQDLSSMREVMAHRDREPMFAASLNKLAIAHMAASRLDLQACVPLPPRDQRMAGAGAYDLEQAHAEVADARVDSLLEDMLQPSGNSAMKALVEALGGPTSLNDYLQTTSFAQRSLQQTYVYELMDEGKFYAGFTTPREVSYMLRDLRDKATADPAYAKVWELAKGHRGNLATLRASASQRGIQIAGKSGQLNGFQLEEGDSPHFLRHEAAVFERGEQAMVVAVMTTAPESRLSPIKRWIASTFERQVGEAVCETLGGQSVSHLGAQGLRHLDD